MWWTGSAALGWYFGLDGGANVYQDFGGERELGVIDSNKFTADTNHHVGGFGGIKFGYVFGPGPIRFGLEEDYFYNGVDATAHVDENRTLLHQRQSLAVEQMFRLWRQRNVNNHRIRLT